MAPHPLIELHDVSYRAGGQTILDRISWRILAGQHWAVLGPNGAGKTTLLRIACGYIWPNAGGEVLRCGESSLDLRELRRSIGWISCSLTDRIPKTEMVLDTVVSGHYAQVGLKRFKSVSPGHAEYAQAKQYLERLDSTDLIKKSFGVLSQGEQQKVLIARALMARPMLIILDEPCAGMDPGARERFLATLNDMVDNPGDVSVILVTHHMEEIIPGITHTMILSHGRIARSGLTHSTLKASVIAKTYGIHVEQLIEKNGRFWPIWDGLNSP